VDAGSGLIAVDQPDRSTDGPPLLVVALLAALGAAITIAVAFFLRRRRVA
jgi:hypothetical protein